MSNSYLVFFHTVTVTVTNQDQKKPKECNIFYLHHQHPTYTQEHLIRGREEEDEGM